MTEQPLFVSGKQELMLTKGETRATEEMELGDLLETLGIILGRSEKGLN